jgi:TatD DNase family protein
VICLYWPGHLSIKSAGDVIDLIKKSEVYKNNVCVLHWFSGSLQQMDQAVEIGCFFSINPQMLTTKSGVDIISEIPKDRIIIETDMPFTKAALDVNEYRDNLKKTVRDIHIIRDEVNEQTISNNSKAVLRKIDYI